MPGYSFPLRLSGKSILVSANGWGVGEPQMPGWLDHGM